MATRHILSCPACGEEMLIDVEPALGGTVQDNLVLVDHRRPGGEAPPATPAAQAAADEAGVDLNRVSGTGKEGKVTKADVVAVAEAPDETLTGTPVAPGASLEEAAPSV